MIGGEVIDIEADFPEEAWCAFYTRLHPLSEENALSLLRNVKYFDGTKEKLLWGS